MNAFVAKRGPENKSGSMLFPELNNLLRNTGLRKAPRIRRPESTRCKAQMPVPAEASKNKKIKFLIKKASF
jgi:hypothetical protein